MYELLKQGMKIIISLEGDGGSLTIRTYKSKREMFKEIDKLNIAEGDE